MKSRIIACDERQALVDCDAPMMCGGNCGNYDVVVIEHAEDGAQFRRMDEKLRLTRKLMHENAEKKVRMDTIRYGARW